MQCIKELLCFTLKCSYFWHNFIILFPNKMYTKSIWRLGVKNPQTIWRYKG